MMDRERRKRIEQVERDLIKNGWKAREVKTCVSCDVLLVEGENINGSYTLPVCRDCRIEYLEEITKEELNKKGGVR